MASGRDEYVVSVTDWGGEYLVRSLIDWGGEYVVSGV